MDHGKATEAIVEKQKEQQVDLFFLDLLSLSLSLSLSFSDLEIHEGFDKKFYLVDAARLFPPESFAMVRISVHQLASTRNFNIYFLFFLQ
jgi:hypothetical protein